MINCRFIKPLDINLLNNISKNYKFAVTIEEGALIGGFGSVVSKFLLKKNIKVSCIGIPDNYIEHGTRKELLDEVGLNYKGIINIIKKMKNE